jgi:DNA-binding transcriptional regulator YiaG
VKITCDHSASSYGIPVILDDAGQVMDYAQGVKALRQLLNLSTKELAEACQASPRTVEGWEQGRMIDAGPLNLMALLLQQSKPAKTKRKNTKE